MASAVAYATKNAKRLKGRERNDFHKFPGLQSSSSMSQSSDEPDQQQHDAAKLSVDFVAQGYSTNNRQDDHDDTDMVDIDLEDGRACMQTEDSVAESSIGLNSLPSDVKEKRVSTISKIFKRRPIEAEKQGMSWMDIRDEGSPACSSGCEPAKGENSLSSLSPRFSPFKNISSMRTKMQSLVSISSGDTDDLPSVEGSFNGDHNLECVGLPTIFSENEGVPESFDGNTTTVERQECLDLSSISNGIQERTIHTDTECVGSPSSIFSGLGGESSSEAREVSRQSFEQSMNQLKNILGTIKSLGSYEESLISASSAGASVEDFKNRAKARLGLNQGQVNDHQIASSHSQESLPSHREVNMPRPDITYEKELLSAAGGHCDGFDFNTVFSDPRNEVYQCNVPSGPLGIVVEATKVGLRVQKINSMSPLRNKISVGDIIIAVDEVDVVGVDPGVFWQLVSRRANKQQRCFVVLRI